MSNNNQIEKAAPSGLAVQNQVVNELQTTMKATGCELTSYGVKCAMNAVAGAVSFLKGKRKTLNDVNRMLFKLSVQSAALLELNYASVPSEIYFDLRGDLLTIKTQGAGNEKLVRKYGVGVVPNTGLKTPWLVREGDDFTYPSYNGLEITPPTWTPKSYNKKVIMVVYPVQKTDGSVEYLISSRDDVYHNLVAQIRQNSLYKFDNDREREKFYETLNDRTLDDLLADVKVRPYINPTYLSSGSREQMIVTKMKNNALKQYPKEYDSSYLKEAAENLYDDVDESLKEKKVVEVDITKKVDEEVNAEADKTAVQDFEVNDDGELIDNEPTEQEPTKEAEPQPKKVEVKPKTDDVDEYF